MTTLSSHPGGDPISLIPHRDDEGSQGGVDNDRTQKPLYIGFNNILGGLKCKTRKYIKK
jgi:hypothetical protein